MDDTSPAVEAPDNGTLPQPIAPLWHTLALLAAFALYAWLGYQRLHGQGLPAAGRIATYLTQMWFSWLLFGATVAGIVWRRDFFCATLQAHAASWRTEWRRAAMTYLGVYMMSLLLFSVAVVTHSVWTKHTHAAPPVATTRQQKTSPLTPTPQPTPGVHDLHESSIAVRKLFRQDTQLALAPRTALQLAFWLLLAATAGFVEEHVFRGYFLQQTLRLCVRARMRIRPAKLLAVLLPSLLFASLHLYEGVGGAAIICCLGMIYSVLALRFGNLRAVILAHFLQDFLAGTFLYVASVRHML